MSKKLAQDEFINRVKLKFGNIYDYSRIKYVNNKIPVQFFCKKHQIYFKYRPDCLIYRSIICPECIKEKISEIGRSQHKDLNTFITEANMIHNNFYSYDKVNYINTHQKVIITCPLHGDFRMTPKDHLDKHGCPYCNRSRGELAIKNYLIKNRIKFKEQYSFDDLLSIKNRKMPFDSYLPDYNICIEYQGEQHFKAIKRSSNDTEDKLQKRLDDQKIRDNLKRNYCIFNGIKEIEINYKNLKKIPDILDNELKLIYINNK